MPLRGCRWVIVYLLWQLVARKGRKKKKNKPRPESAKQTCYKTTAIYGKTPTDISTWQMALTETALRLGTVPLPAFNRCHKRELAVSLLLAPSTCPSPGSSWPWQPAKGCAGFSRAAECQRRSWGVHGDGAFHPRQRHSGPGLCASFTVGLCKEPLARPAAAMAFPALPGACPLQTLRVNKGWFLFPILQEFLKVTADEFRST